jgi:hypothetical protein
VTLAMETNSEVSWLRVSSETAVAFLSRGTADSKRSQPGTDQAARPANQRKALAIVTSSTFLRRAATPPRHLFKCGSFTLCSPP